MIDSSENLSFLPRAYKKALKQQRLYQVVDRIDLSSLPKDCYRLAFFTNDTLYETTYDIDLSLNN